jgi:hypothetical protein
VNIYLDRENLFRLCSVPPKQSDRVARGAIPQAVESSVNHLPAVVVIGGRGTHGQRSRISRPWKSQLRLLLGLPWGLRWDTGYANGFRASVTRRRGSVAAWNEGHLGIGPEVSFRGAGAISKIRIPINEDAGDKGQIEEYLKEYAGEGIQHVALGARNLFYLQGVGDDLSGQGEYEFYRWFSNDVAYELARR